jgi:uncharacterized protein
MLAIVCAAVSGTLFGLGLTISHMVDPAKVLAFLDMAGDWDPSLACVMLGALSVTIPTYALARRRAAPLCARDFMAPTASQVDKPLAWGACCSASGGVSSVTALGPRLRPSVSATHARCYSLLPCWSAWRCSAPSGAVARRRHVLHH